MAVFRQPSSRKRTKNLDLEASAKGRRGGLASVISPKNLSATLMTAGFWAAITLVVVVGVPGLGATAVVGVALLLLLGMLLVGWFVSLDARDLLRDRRRLLLVLSITLLVLSLTKIVIRLGFPDEHLVPLAVFSVALSVGAGRPLAVLWTLVTAFAIGLVSGLEPRAHERVVPVLRYFDLSLAVTLGSGALVAVLALDKVSRRGKVIRAGVLAGVTYAVTILAMAAYLKGGRELVGEMRHDPTAASALARTLVLAFLNGAFTGYFLVEAGIRFVETSFDVVTDLRLGELADLNQPILRQFSSVAPGTWHHSQMVGRLSEAAAEAIGAHALLCRVGALFHDIGKMAKPEYFIENVRGSTKHDGLTPRMSTLIIIGHVKDGVEIAEELGLPSKVIDFIPEHHGTIAVEYFYHQAKKQQEEQGGPPVALDDFRYPGPKPRTRETAITMIADTVEAMSRVLEKPNAQRVEALVQEVVGRRLEQGQFDDCSITLRELKEVERAMVRELLGAHHGRIKYPSATPDLGPLKVPEPTESGARFTLVRDLAEGPGVPSDAAAPRAEQDSLDPDDDEEDASAAGGPGSGATSSSGSDSGKRVAVEADDEDDDAPVAKAVRR